MTIRVGHGYDVHRLVPDRPLMLGGVRIAFDRGLDGHSDADVLLHAVADALYGAAGLGDIGRHFPPDDPQWKDADSRDLLARCVKQVAQAGWRVGNIDVTVIAQAPRLAPHLPAMQTCLAQLCRVTPAEVNIKATTTEGLGPMGRGEGIAAHAVCLIVASDG